MTKQYEISIKHDGGDPTINFANNSNEFVEVTFTVNGKDIKTGQSFTESERGFCYPGHYERNIKQMVSYIRLKEGDQVRAYIYRGVGKYQEIDFDIPPFIRRKIGQDHSTAKKKAIFKRSTNVPAQVLNCVV